MKTDHHDFASDLAHYLLWDGSRLGAGADNGYQLLAKKDDEQLNQERGVADHLDISVGEPAERTRSPGLDQRNRDPDQKT